jgi:putative NADH-flavin reductase
MKALIFGSKGSIGSYIFNKFSKEDIKVIGTTSNIQSVTENIILVKNDNYESLKTLDPVNIVVWAFNNSFRCL